MRIAAFGRFPLRCIAAKNSKRQNFLRAGDLPRRAFSRVALRRNACNRPQHTSLLSPPFEVVLMSSTERRIDDLVVVDASIDDYAALFSDRELQDLPCRHFSSGEEALQHFDPWLATLWM